MKDDNIPHYTRLKGCVIMMQPLFRLIDHEFSENSLVKMPSLGEYLT